MKNSLHSISNYPQLKAKGFFTFILFFIHFFSPAQPGIWQQKQSLGIGSDGRQYGVGFSIGDKGYFGTGITLNQNFRNDFWEYDPATNAWTQKADFGGAPRGGATGFGIGNKGYIGTGNFSAFPGSFSSDFWEYDPTSNTWTRRADFGGLPTTGAVGFSIGNKGYLGTGVNTNDYSADFWEYNPAADTWTKKANYGGVPRFGATGFSIGSKGYIGTGYDSRGDISGNRKDFWEYDPATDTWTQKADFGGFARSLASGFSIGSKGYLGTGSIEPERAGLSDDFWEYDPTTDAWTIKAYFPGGARINTTGFNIGSKGYLGFGGLPSITDTGRNDLWEYTPGSESAITTHVSTTTFCSGLIYAISYTTSGIFNADNVFTAQLSDPSGSFINPYNIGSVSSTVSGTINAIIPPFPGTNFHIRVISSSPAILGSDDGTNYTIDPPPVVKTKNITVYLNSHGTVTITPDQVNNGSTGYCCGLSYSLDKTTFCCADLGANTVTLTVKDANGRTSSGNAVVTVVDNMRPLIKYAFAYPNILCPADGKMKQVALFYWTKDNCTLAGTTLSITSNEPQSGNHPDWIILDKHHVKLRASRPGNCMTRIYFITITAQDEAGNKSTQTVKVTVCGNKQGFNKSEVYGSTKDDGTGNDLSVQVMPNPSQHYFTLVTQSSNDESIAVSVTDALGRVIDLKQNIAANSTLKIGEGYKSGIYFAQLRQGNKRVTVRLVKQAN